MPLPSVPERRQGVVVFALDKRRVSAFYQRTLGLSVVETAAGHDLLQGPGQEVVVHAIPKRAAAGIVIETPPRPREDTPIKPTFIVDDLDAVRAAAEATGGYLKPKAGAWRFRGCVVLDGWDPEGNVVQFKQVE